MEPHIIFLATRMEGVERLLSEITDEDVTVSVVTQPHLASTRVREMPVDCVVCEVDASPTGVTGFLQGIDDVAPDLPVILWAPEGGNPPLAADHYDGIHEGDPVGLGETVMDLISGEPETITAESPKRNTVATRQGRVFDIWDREGFFETVLDNLLDVFFVFTTDRELLAWNARLEEVTGLDADELAGYDPIRLIVEEQREEAYDRFVEVVTSGEATMEVDVPTPDGTHPFEVTASLITDRTGAPQYICGIGRDVNELRRKEAELERKQAQLNEAVEELQRSNAELEHFASVASHDMKEPLRMVSRYLELLERRHGDQLDGEASEFIEFAVDGADRMRRMIDHLLAFSRIDRQDGTVTTVDCNAVLDTVRRNLQMAIGESDAEVTVGDLPTVTGDREQLVQLFQNLVGNAIKYAGDGPPRVEVTATRRGETWEFSVSDDGVGITEERIDRVFDIFYTDSDDESTGIGLAISRKIVQRHGGTIEVESTVGEGTTFRFTLPDQSVSLDEDSADQPQQ